MNNIISYEAMRQDCKNLVGELWDELVSFYSEILQDKSNDAIIFVTRRCHVLYAMVALCEGWEHDKRVMTDFGIYVKKDSLRKAKQIVVVDDIAMRGYSVDKIVKNVIEIIDDKNKDKVNVQLFALCNDVPQSDRVLSNGKVIDRCHTLARHDADILSIKLVQLIEASGLPYATFLYPVAYKSDIRERKENDDRTVSRGYNHNVLFRKIRPMECRRRGGSSSIWNKIAIYTCSRIYFPMKPLTEESYVLELPFVFLKDLRLNDKSADTYYECLIYALKELGDWIQKPVEKYFEEAHKDRELYRYLRCLETLLYSRIISLEDNEEKDIDERLVRYIVGGSFDDDILEGISNKLSKDNTDKFLQNFDRKLEEEMNGNVAELFNDIVQSEDKKAEKILSQDDITRFDLPLDAQIDIFWKIRLNNRREDKESPAVHFLSLYHKLKETDNDWNEDNILKDVIKCWDIGVANYKYGVSGEEIYAYCSAGEMSILRLQAFFGEALGRFYKESAHIDKRYSSQELWDYVSEGTDDMSYMRDDFIQWVDDNKGNMYQYAIFE